MVLLALIAGAAAAGLSDGWQVDQAEQFCLLRLAAPEASGAELGLALDIKDKARIILSNPAWQLEPDRSYPLAAGIDGAIKQRKARGMRLGADWVALVADVDEQSFLDQFARSSALQFEVKKVKPGTVGSRFELRGTAAATKALRACQVDLVTRTRDLAKLKLDQRNRPQPERSNEDPDDNVPER